jgi:glycerophosphoryl diester phosphodiesterase
MLKLSNSSFINCISDKNYKNIISDSPDDFTKLDQDRIQKFIKPSKTVKTSKIVKPSNTILTESFIKSSDNPEIVFDCKSLIIGHRGVKGYAPDNTIESIIKSLKMGVDGIEFNVQRCSTGELILYKDNIINNVYKDEFYFEHIDGVSINKLQWYHIYNTELIDSVGKTYKIPKLIELLEHPDMINSDVLINIVLTYHQPNVDLVDKTSEALCDLIDELVEEGTYSPERFLLSSANWDSILYLSEFKEEKERKNKKYQKMEIGWIVSSANTPKEGLAFYMKNHLKVVSHLILNKDILSLSLIDELKQLKLKVFVENINTNLDLKLKSQELDNIENIVDGIITDNPNIFL